jgi:hypothetical protein
MALTKKLYLFAFCVMVFSVTVFTAVKKNSDFGYYLMLGWDSQGYYLYLPAVFINHSFANLDVKEDKSNPDRWTYRPYPGTNKIFTKYTYGVALMEAPFFLASRKINKWQGNDESNIYGETFMKGLICADAFYLSAGLFILGIYLLGYFRLRAVLITEIIIWLGTSLYYYSAFSVGFSHVCSFFLIVCLIYLTPILYERRKLIHVIIAVAILGLIVVIRPTNIVFGLYMLLYDVFSWSQLKERVTLLWQYKFRFIWFAIFGFMAWIPQLMYWKYLSGHWLLYSYEKEGFIYWSDPKIFSVLFSPQNGFFLYAPLMLLSLVGLIMCLRKKTLSSIAVLLIFLATDYICGSWWYWNFGGAYGFRPYIDFLGVLALPLAYFVASTERWHKAAQIALGAVVVFLLFLSIRLQVIYDYPWEGAHWGWKNVAWVHKEALFLNKPEH